MADDYLTKPFNLKELLLRVSNLIVRTQSLSNNSKNKILFLAGCKIDLKSFVVEDNLGEKYTLTHKQIKLLKLFIERKNQVISRKEILEKVWGYDVYPSSRTIDNFILLFRKVFEKNLPSSTYFKSIRGVGYKFTP
jgi:two-component system alkaline phosphatase synthesis response regulator PhoP